MRTFLHTLLITSTFCASACAHFGFFNKPVSTSPDLVFTCIEEDCGDFAVDIQGPSRSTRYYSSDGIAKNFNTSFRGYLCPFRKSELLFQDLWYEGAGTYRITVSGTALNTMSYDIVLRGNEAVVDVRSLFSGDISIFILRESEDSVFIDNIKLNKDRHLVEYDLVNQQSVGLYGYMPHLSIDGMVQLHNEHGVWVNRHDDAICGDTVYSYLPPKNTIRVTETWQIEESLWTDEQYRIVTEYSYEDVNWHDPGIYNVFQVSREFSVQCDDPERWYCSIKD